MMHTMRWVIGCIRLRGDRYATLERLGGYTGGLPSSRGCSTLSGGSAGGERISGARPMHPRADAWLTMKYFYSDIFSFPLPEAHRFPLQKYALLRERVFACGWTNPDDLTLPEPATDEQLLRVHSTEYVERVLQGTLDPREIRRIGLPWSPELVERARRSVGGTVAAAHSALKTGISFNLAGGTHHAHRDWGSGFCIFNDVAVAAHDLQIEHKVARILVLDCDVHQGDGTAAIFTGDDRVFTFSIHGERNFPFRKTPSDLDVGLPDGADDENYSAALADGLQRIFNGQRKFDFVFYLAGADPYHRDSFGRLALTKSGLQARDRLVFHTCIQHDLPVAVVLSGGYAPDMNDIVEIHLNTVQLAHQLESQWRKITG